MRELGINKDTFTKYLRRLVDDGYIVKERTSRGNIYTIVQALPGYDVRYENNSANMTDKLILENVAAKGYGTVPKLVMLDKRLTAQAKAIYAYFASFTGAGTTAFPRRGTVMRELGIASITFLQKSWMSMLIVMRKRQLPLKILSRKQACHGSS